MPDPISFDDVPDANPALSFDDVPDAKPAPQEPISFDDVPAVQPQQSPQQGKVTWGDIGHQAWEDIKNVIPSMLHLPEQAGKASEQWRMGERTPEAAGTMLGAAATGLKMGRVPFRTGTELDLGYGKTAPIPREVPVTPEGEPTRITVHPEPGGGIPPSPVEPPQDPILSRIGQEPDKPRLPTFGRLYTMVKDDLHPMREARDYLTQGQDLQAGEDPYVLARLTRGSQGKAEHFVDYGTFDPETGKNLGPGLKQIIKPVANDLDGFRKYMLAKRAVELHGRNIETGIPIDEARTAVAEGQDKYAKPFQQWVKYQRDLLGYMVRSGIIARDQAAAMMEANKDYTPFYRVMEEGDPSAPGYKGAGLKVRQPIRGMSGSERKILDPIESTIKNTYLYIALADRNIALRALKNLAEKSDRGNEILQKVPPEVHPIRVTGKETERALAGMGHNLPPEPIEDFTIFRPNAFRPAPDEIAIYSNGKREVFKTDPYLASAVNGLDREGVNMLVKLASYPAKWLRAGATLSPEFIARNPIRDQFSAFVFSALGRGYVPFYDFVKGVGSVLKQGEGYQNWLKSGGANAAMVSIDRNYMQNLIRRMKDPTFLGTMKNVVRSPLELLQALSETVENATRVGEFMRLQKRGESLPASGYASREATLDFQRIGSKMRGVNAIAAFFNAQLEGVDRAARSMWSQPGRFAATVGAGITLPSIYLWYANHDDPRYKEIPRWQKDLFWIVPTDNWQPVTPQQATNLPDSMKRLRDGQWEYNAGKIYRIPKPFELGVMFGSVPERILDAWVEQNPRAFKDIGSSLWQAFMPNFTPTAVEPFLEQWANRSFFTGRPLVPKYLEGLQPKYQANPYTHDAAQIVGNMISKIPGMSESSFASPIMVENYIRAWTGGLGQHMLDASDWSLRQAGLTPSKVEPTPTNADRTLLKAFSVRWPEAGANSIQDFYEEYNRRAKAKATFQYLTKTGEKEEGAALQRENIMFTADNIQKAIGRQLKLVRDAYRDKRMSPDEKRKFIDLSYLQMIKMAQTGNMIFAKTKAAFEEKRGLQ